MRIMFSLLLKQSHDFRICQTDFPRNLQHDFERADIPVLRLWKEYRGTKRLNDYKYVGQASNCFPYVLEACLTLNCRCPKKIIYLLGYLRATLLVLGGFFVLFFFFLYLNLRTTMVESVESARTYTWSSRHFIRFLEAKFSVDLFFLNDSNILIVKCKKYNAPKL